MDTTLTVVHSGSKGRWPWLLLNAHGATMYACKTAQDAIECGRWLLMAAYDYNARASWYDRKPS